MSEEYQYLRRAILYFTRITSVISEPCQMFACFAQGFSLQVFALCTLTFQRLLNTKQRVTYIPNQDDGVNERRQRHSVIPCAHLKPHRHHRHRGWESFLFTV